MDNVFDNDYVSQTKLAQLNGDVLGKTISWLNVNERVAIERVCKRWMWLARKSLGGERSLIITSAISGVMRRKLCCQQVQNYCYLLVSAKINNALMRQIISRFETLRALVFYGITFNCKNCNRLNNS